MNAWMSTLIPDGCPMKEMMKCSGGTKSSCEATEGCKWKTSDGCSDSSFDPVVEYTDECELGTEALYEMLMKGSCDADIGLLWLVEKTTTACASHTQEVACKAQ